MWTKSSIRLSNGKLVDLLDLKVEDIDLRSISRSLNAIRRFTGHWETHPPLTVAQHTMLTMEIASRLYPREDDVEFDCLLHDMPEAFYGDMSSPLKRCINEGDGYKNVITEVDERVYEALWKHPKPFTQDVHDKRKNCDIIALDIEKGMMWGGREMENYAKEMPFDKGTQIALFTVISSIPVYDLQEVYASFFPLEKNSTV